MQKMKHNIVKLAEDIKSEYRLETYWDYRDEMTKEQVMKIIIEEDGLMDVNNEIWEQNIDCNCEVVLDAVKDYLRKNDIELDKDEREELIQECEDRFNF